MKHREPLFAPPPLSKRLHPLPDCNTGASKSPLDLGIPHHRPLLRIKETALALRVSLTTVRNMVDAGVLDAGPVNILNNPQRIHLRITRESVERFHRMRFGR